MTEVQYRNPIWDFAGLKLKWTVHIELVFVMCNRSKIVPYTKNIYEQ